MRENQNDESYRTSKDTQIKSGGCPSEPAKTLMDLQVEAYENRLRERLTAKYSTRTPSEAKRVEQEIEKLVQIYAEGRILLQGGSVGPHPPRAPFKRKRANARD